MLFGSVLGFVIGKTVAAAHLERNSNITVLPYYDPVWRAAGVSWRDYDNFMQKFIKEADQTIEVLPLDLDIKPYRDEHDVKLLKRMQAAGRRRK